MTFDCNKNIDPPPVALLLWELEQLVQRGVHVQEV